jgi:hypothetical protein
MSPHRDRFINFVFIVPKAITAITAANKLAFDATGAGDMEIEVPLGSRRSSKVLLKDVLYTQDMGVTLVSISRITAAGHKAVFDGPTLKLLNSTKELLREIPVSEGLYRVVSMVNPLTQGIFEGIELDKSQNPRTCDACKFAKTSRKAIKRERVIEQTKSFGDEVHPDLWGPAPGKKKGRNEYYISLTDDRTRFTKPSSLIIRPWARTQRIERNTAEIKVLALMEGGSS